MLLLSQVHIEMFFQVDSIDIGIEVDVLFGVPARGMAENMLCDIRTSDFIEASSSGMPQEMRM